MFNIGTDLPDSGDPATTKTVLTHSAARKFLEPLSKGEQKKLGLELGLRWPRLKKMMEGDSLLDDMLDSWLQEDDNVTKTSGHPSLKSLATALEKAGLTNVATSVRESMSSKLW